MPTHADPATADDRPTTVIARWIHTGTGARLRLLASGRLLKAIATSREFFRIRGVVGEPAARMYAEANGYSPATCGDGSTAYAHAPTPRRRRKIDQRLCPTVPTAEADPTRGARLDRYASRADKRLSLFTSDDTPEPVPERSIVCWCCGRPPDPARGEKQSHMDHSGWAVRVTQFALGGDSYEARELYCPDCFGEWGWPDDYD
jgi:hypothetical protein